MAMDKFNWEKVETIIDEVLALPESKHQEFIEYKCGNDVALKNEVTLLLKSIFDSDGWLEKPLEYKSEFYEGIANDLEKLESSSSLIGQPIGSYTITEELGTGGMGSVYLARRSDDAFEHRVAIKMIRQGKASQENIERFKQERRILAELNHPGIAKLFDGSITEDGIPYLIMEYIDGMPVTQYCKQSALSLEDRIDLFKKILEAVRHAHENAIIHRDLKPSNILVTNKGEVKILDFGISKMLDDDSGSDLTQTKARLLTPRYAAPEQIMQQPVTTATDLYALGILFYELVSGEHPFDLEKLSQYDMEQVILAQQPSAPSAKVAASFPVSETQLKGDLDAMALKGIRKEPDRRYRTTNEFLDDLQNYNQGLPVKAHADSFRYRAGKFFNRHRTGITTAAGILLILIGLTAFYTWRITGERNQAQLQAERAEEIRDFLVSILQINNPSENMGKNLTVSDALTRGIDYLDDQSMSSFNRAIILGTIGSIQINIGDIDQAGISLKRAIDLVTDSLKKQTNRTLAIGTEYAEWQETIGNNKKAEEIFHLTDSLFQVNQLTQSTSFLAHLLNYSDFMMETGQFEQAIKTLLRAKMYFQNSSDESPSMLGLRADLYNNLGRAYQHMGQNDKTLEYLDKALVIKKELYNENNPKIGQIYHNMGVVYGTIGELSKAMGMAKRAYEIRMNTLGPDHQLVGSTLHLMGNLSLELENYDQAFKYIKRSIAIIGKQHGTNHFRYAFAIREYAKALAKTGRYDEAERQLDEAASIIIDSYGKEHAYYGYLTYTYATIFGEAGNYTDAMQQAQLSISIFEESFGPNHPNVGKAYFQQGKYALKLSQFRQADTLLTTALKIFELHFDDGNTFIEQTDSLLSVTKKQFEDSVSSNSLK